MLICSEQNGPHQIILNPIQDGFFRHCPRMGVSQKSPSPLSKICHTCASIMNLGTVTTYLKKFRKIYESRDI